MEPDYTNEQMNAHARTLKQRIMRRIYILYMLRTIAPFAFDCLVIIIVAFIATLFVSVKDVWENLSMAQDSGQLSSFSFSALSETELTTKLLLIVLGVVGYVTYRHLKRAWRAVRTLKQGMEGRTKESSKF